MAITSRLLAIERLFGQRLDQIDESSLDRLVSTEQRETDQLDFKSKWTVSADADELRKDVCAFANSRGGLIIYGVRDEESKAVELTPFEATTDFRNQVAGILFSGCRPTPRFELTQLESSRSPGRYYVLLAVPQSSEAPHARLKDVKQEHMLNFPLRVETITRFMSESELAARYRARFQADAERSERTSELEQSFPIDGGSSQLSLAMRFCGVPSAAGEARIGSELINTWYERIRLLSDGTRSFGCPPTLTQASSAIDVEQFESGRTTTTSSSTRTDRLSRIRYSSRPPT